MQVKLISKSVVALEGENKQVMIELNGGEYKGEDPTVLVVSANQRPGVIYGPGEYEYDGVGIVGVETRDAKMGLAEIMVIRIDEISVMAVTSQPEEIKKEQWDLLGEVDILLIDKEVQMTGLEKFINRINPYVLAVTNMDAAEAEKSTGLKVEATDKKFKFMAKDFEAEDPATRLLILG
ncbi:hypothetical protein KC640_03345 [Candidatus Dojkabacteria bacterium]|uniref:Uncharacterized protein n=1 Tax=Candidatus Dojkabacteria bacterium TaxID=2099670 RepID=A0A955I621_9BACT|nr:hypothetical protein [Candidatus Dojkabacteria bacterium]